MPNRIIKESICTSDGIDSLSWFEEVLFYRLIVNCDDFGRFDGRIAVIKNRLFPLKEDLTARNVRNGVMRLVSAGLVALYEVEGKPFLYLPTWNDHQSVRAKRSKYPPPEQGVNTSESNCMQMLADASKCPRNPIQSNTESYSESNTESNSEAKEAAFERFWNVYPKKVGKQAAKKAFAKVREDVQTLVEAVERHKLSSQWCAEDGRYIPHAATWLNQERWTDVMDTNMGRKVPYGASGILGEAEKEAIRKILEEEGEPE